jgi:hypothetical protein
MMHTLLTIIKGKVIKFPNQRLFENNTHHSLLYFCFSASAQSDWNQSFSYDLHARFTPAEHTVDAMMKLKYANHSPDTLTFYLVSCMAQRLSE